MADFNAVPLIYVPEAITSPVSLEDLAAQVGRELERISAVSIVGLARQVEALNAAPTRVFDGMTVLADGVNWNPGAGAGVYTYYGAAWNKLG